MELRSQGDKIERVRISEASKPKDGMFSIYIDHYWAVTDDLWKMFPTMSS